MRLFGRQRFSQSAEHAPNFLGCHVQRAEASSFKLKTVCREHRVPHRQRDIYAKRIFLRELAYEILIYLLILNAFNSTTMASFCMGVIPHSEGWGHAVILAN